MDGAGFAELNSKSGPFFQKRELEASKTQFVWAHL
jgi:hypothetical protein